MKKPLIMIHILIISLLVLSSPSSAGQFTVIKVYDGDTIMAEGHDIVMYVLLAGVDAPEIASRNHEQDQPYGQEAKQYLENKMLNKRVEITGYGIGPHPYNHLIGEIFLGDTNINIELIKEGLAEVWREKSPAGFPIDLYRKAQEEAQKVRRGIWSLGDKYMSPRDWREIHTGK
ncbi:MAG: nuclease [Deltaproteobacteria bacterium]|nr:thermonuclease family protein [Deltaproteobacteria bacterium]MBW2078362.1 thermonuclease family protein [Deltaproteobacteria bacterium]MBW2311590.1 thermonuclease family protein [Deltaproteobacteria bacterium]RLB30686.1 MAG: nuclease [Deltaproteobacteria bacterium]